MIAVIGILIALLIPAVQGAREAARRTVCVNHLRQLGFALLEHADTAQALPIGCVGCKTWFPPICNKVAPQPQFLAWNVRVLPFIERQALADQYDLSLIAWAPANRIVGSAVIEEFLCPSEPSVRTHEPYGSWRGASYTDYGGIYGVEGDGRDGEECSDQTLSSESLGAMLYDLPTRLAEITDGASHTLALAELLERRTSEVTWINGHNLFAQEAETPINAVSGLGGDLGSPHPGGALAAACDGSVRWLGNSMPQEVLVALLTRAGEETAQ